MFPLVPDFDLYLLPLSLLSQLLEHLDHLLTLTVLVVLNLMENISLTLLMFCS